MSHLYVRSFILLSCTVLLFCLSTIGGEDLSSSNCDKEIQAVALTEKDEGVVKNIRVKRQLGDSWRQESSCKNPDERPCLMQEISVDDVEVKTKLGMFKSKEEAESAAVSYMKTAYTEFRKGLWQGFPKAPMEDKCSCWVNTSEDEESIMVQCGSFCFLISCRHAPKEKLRSTAVDLATILATKTEYWDLVFTDNEMEDLTVEKQFPTWWLKAMSKEGTAQEQRSIDQIMSVDKVKVRVKLARFADGKEAAEGASTYAENMASVFVEGVWKDTPEERLGDFCWSNTEQESDAVVVRSGSLCFLVRCCGSDQGKRRATAISLSKKIMAKDTK